MRAPVIACLTVVAASCAGGTQPDAFCTQTSAIVNGSAQAPPELGSVAEGLVALRLRRHIAGETFDNLCTGVRLADDHVVTAAHCVRDEPLPTITVSSGAVTTSSECPPTRAEEAVRPRLHPLHDVAVLDGVVATGNATRVCSAVPPVGAGAFVAGYGVDERGAVGTRRFLATRIVSATEAAIEAQADTLSGPCLGDSGGPLFVEDAEGWCVAGTLSTGSADCRGRDRYVLLAPLLAWIDPARE